MLFDVLDDNKDGLVTFEEFFSGLRPFLEDSAEEETVVDTSEEPLGNQAPDTSGWSRVKCFDYCGESDSEEGSEDGSDVGLKRETVYNKNSPLVKEIRRVLLRNAEGIRLMCLTSQAYKVKVIHREITKMGIPAVIETLEDGIVDPKDIIYNPLVIFRDLADRVEKYDQEDMLNIKPFFREDFEMPLPEGYFIELVMHWVIQAKPSEDDLVVVVDSIDWSKSCRQLEIAARYHWD